jgi:hypothetical protein
MSVSNMAFFLDNFSKDCGPLQYVREFTQNAIEAIRKAGREHGYIVWSFDKLTYERTGIKKLCVTDNGCGMSSDELVRHINNLSSSGGTQAFDRNYGIGAKVSSATRNHAGVEYLSWQQGEGNTICLWKDPVTGEYGLKPFRSPDGDDHVAELSPIALEKFPSVAEFGSGTHVVLHGQTENEDTFSTSKEVSGRGAGQWVRKYLNTRYFRIPQNIRIDCQTAGGGDDGFRFVTGQGPVLDAIAGELKGKVQLKNATAYWWIVPEAESDLDVPVRMHSSSKPIASMKTFNPSYFVTGHIAALFQDELHDTIRSSQGRALLQQCGVIVGPDRVVIYVEPTGSGVAPNMARTNLLIDGEPLPWGDWADEFRAKLPRAIRDFMAAMQPAPHDSKNEDERIRSVMDLYTVPKYKPDPKGHSTMADPDSGGGSTDEPVDEPGPRPNPRPGPRPVPQNSAYSELINPNGIRATDITAKQDLPKVIWVSVENKLRHPDMHPNYAAWFTHPNLVNINADFGGYLKLIDRICEKYQDQETARPVVTAVVQSWWSQTLKECIQGLRGLVASGGITRIELSRLLSERSEVLLTASVMPKYLVYQAIHREVSGLLGKARAAAG